MAARHMEMPDKSRRPRGTKLVSGMDGGRYGGLADFPLFAALSPESLIELSEGLHRRKWSAGALIFSRGDEGDNMLAICTGRVRMSLSSAQGREIVLSTLGAGDILGEMALIDGKARSADATAVQDTSCLVLPRAQFEAVASRRPDVGLAMARYLCTHLRRTNFQMESIALYDLQTRLVRFLLYVADQMPDSSTKTSKETSTGTETRRKVTFGLSQGEIAAILGASRPKVNLALQALFARGALHREGDALLYDVEVLSRLAEGDAT